ncbi:unnamed protein product [Urochloa humidicola]
MHSCHILNQKLHCKGAALWPSALPAEAAPRSCLRPPPRSPVWSHAWPPASIAGGAHGRLLRPPEEPRSCSPKQICAEVCVAFWRSSKASCTAHRRSSAVLLRPPEQLRPAPPRKQPALGRAAAAVGSCSLARSRLWGTPPGEPCRRSLGHGRRPFVHAYTILREEVRG